MLNSLEAYEENRKWLEYNGFSEELKKIEAELYVVRLLVMNELNPDGCIINDGVCGLLDTIGHKISDIASGRLPNMLLPELSENKSDNKP